MPKKKGGKKGSKIIDGVATNEMTREQLMGHVKRMQMELDREREERNFFILEREKLYALWDITVEQLAAAKAETRLSIVRMDDNDRDREKEMYAYKQKLRYLMTEQSKCVAQVRLHGLKHMRSLEESTFTIQKSLKETIEKKDKDIFQAQTSIQTLARNLQLDNAKQVSNLRSQFCIEVQRIEATFERLLHEREEVSRVMETVEIQRTNTEKSTQINNLIQLHEEQIKQMKTYFNEITANNFAVISALQAEIFSLRRKEKELEDLLQKERKEYKALEEELVKEKVEATRKIQEDRKSAHQVKRRLDVRSKQLKTFERHNQVLEMSNEALLEKSKLAKGQREMMKTTYTQAIVEMQRKSNMHRLILEMKLNALSEKAKKKKSQKGEGETGSGEEHQDELNDDGVFETEERASSSHSRTPTATASSDKEIDDVHPEHYSDAFEEEY